MLRVTSTPMNLRRLRVGRRPLAGTGFACAVAVAAALAGGVPAGAATTVKTTIFTGAIVSGTGHYANYRGAVRLVLRAPAATTSRLPFTLTLSGPACSGQALHAPRHCVSLAGKLTGSAFVSMSNPDVGRSFALTALGKITPLGHVSVTGTSHSLGFIAHGRIPLSLHLRSSAGGLTITAQSPQVNGFSSPF
ncbi:MAG: hypothetical protein ACR2KV_01985 [Solirubrobacteraceae bacterium]